MAKRDDRFEVIQTQGNGLTSAQIQVLMDTATGVQYLFIQAGYAGGLCPLLNADGTPITWKDGI